MRKNRLIALIGTLTMAAAGLAAVSVGVSSKKADSVSAATSKINGTNIYLEHQNDGGWTDSSKAVYLFMGDVNFVDGSGYSSVNEVKSDAFGSSVSVSGGALHVKMKSDNENQYYVIVPWYISSFNGQFYSKKSDGDHWAKNKDGGSSITVNASIGNGYNVYFWGENGFGGADWYTKVSQPASYSFQYDEEQYSVNVSAGTGGTVSPSGTKNYNKNQILSLSATPSTGYAFSSWSDSGDQTHSIYVDSAKNISATFSANSYTVTLNDNEGSGGPASVSATYGAAMPSLSSLPSRVGYIFDGYWDSATAGTQYYADNGTSARNWDKASTATLYAHWTPNPKTPYTVKHYQQNTDLSTYSLSGTDSLSGTTGTQTNAEARSTAGFTAQSFSQQTIAADGSTEVNINYNRNLYTMTYDYGEATGEITPPKENDQIYYGCTPTQSGVSVPQPEWSGHDFNGWKYTDYGQDLNITNNTPYGIADNITVHAQWSVTPVSSYSVSFVIADGQSSWGSLSSSTGSTTLSVAAGSTISVDNNVMTIDGKSVTATAATDSTGQYTYAFKSFSPNSGTINADTVITVEFSQTTNQYLLAWDFDEGTPEGSYSPAGDYNWGATITIPTNVSKEGCSFDGLFFDSDFTNPCDDDFEIKQNTTVYAKFTVLTYDVSVGVDSSCTGWGTVSSTIVEDVPYNTSISASNNVLTVGQTQITATAKTGPEATYSFLRWDGIPASEKVTGDLNIKAVFSKVDTKCQLTWDFAGGSTSDTEYTVSGSYVYGTRINAPTTASMSKDGYTFAGWDNEVASTLTSDQTYTAQWVRPNGYYVHNYRTDEMIKMELNGNSTTEYKAVATFLDNDTFKVTKVENGVETTWYGWETVKYDTYDPKIDARCTAQMIAENDGYKPNIKANIDGQFTIYFDEAGADDWKIYIPSIVNVEFDLNGVEGTGPENQVVNSRGLVTEPVDPETEEQYEFAGWYHEAACTTPWDFSSHQVVYFSTDDEHVATQKIYAKWVSTATYNITLDDNGGSGGEGTIENVKEGDEISVTALPKKEKYSFQGYFTATTGGTKVIDSDGSNETPYSSSFGETLYAQWDLDRGTYLTGSFGDADWARDGKYVMTLNPGTEHQYVIKGVELEVNDELRPYFDTGDYDWGEIGPITWSHPNYKGEKSGNNCKVLTEGTYDIYYDTVTHELHLAMPTMPENGRYFLINEGKANERLVIAEEHAGWSGVEYKAEIDLAKGDTIKAYYQDATKAESYVLHMNESVKVFDVDSDGRLVCTDGSHYSLYMIAKDDQHQQFNYVSIFCEGEAEAVAFAKAFNAAMKGVCNKDGETPLDDEGSKKGLKTIWSEQANLFANMEGDQKAVTAAKALLASSTLSTSTNEDLKNFAESYDYIYEKYGSYLSESGADFAGRNVTPQSGSRNLISINNVSTSTWIIASVAIVGIAAVGVFFIYRKRKEN